MFLSVYMSYLSLGSSCILFLFVLNIQIFYFPDISKTNGTEDENAKLCHLKRVLVLKFIIIQFEI